MKALSTILKVAGVAAAFYFLIWPFINSAISHNYYNKVNTDGSPSTTWIAELKSTNDLIVEVYGRGNIATGAAADEDYETYENTLDQADVDQITEVFNKLRGMHLLARLSSGYAFKYDGQGFQSTFFSYADKENLLLLNQALEYYARGDEVIKGSGYKSALDQGRAKLKSLRDKLDLSTD